MNELINAAEVKTMSSRETETGHSQAIFYADGEMWIVEKLTIEGLL